MVARALTLQTHQSAEEADFVGAAVSAVLPLAGLVIVNAGAEMAGLSPVTGGVAAALPTWIGATAMVTMLPMWGLARWLLAREGGDGRLAGRWIVALIVVAILAPFAIGVADAFFASVIAMVVLVTGLIALGRAAAVSASAAALLLPGLIWTGAGALIGFSVVAGGWSPPFALTETKGH